MELFIKLFGNLLAFVYHCFDRIVIHGYLTGLSRPEHVVHFFREVGGVPVITKETLRQRTNDYQSWVEAFEIRSGAKDRCANGVGGRRCGRAAPCQGVYAGASGSRLDRRSEC